MTKNTGERPNGGQNGPRITLPPNFVNSSIVRTPDGKLKQTATPVLKIGPHKPKAEG